METKFNFNSAICTNRQQSERLLALGLKKETADCHWSNVRTIFNREWLLVPITIQAYTETEIPAWSLHRLMILAEMNGSAFSDLDSAYETTISIIAAKIRFGYFNKEYLDE